MSGGIGRGLLLRFSRDRVFVIRGEEFLDFLLEWGDLAEGDLRILHDEHFSGIAMLVDPEESGPGLL